jgi:hypothetical protein
LLLDHGRRRRRPERGEPCGAQAVGEAGNQRCLRTDDDEVVVLGDRVRGERLDVLRRDRNAPCVTRDTCVPRGAGKIGEKWAATERPCERGLAPATADEEDLHERSSRPAVVSDSRSRPSRSRPQRLSFRPRASTRALPGLVADSGADEAGVEDWWRGTVVKTIAVAAVTR